MKYEEIIFKFVEGKLVKFLDWINDQLDKDPGVISGTSQKKIALRRFLSDISEQFENFLEDPEDDPRNNQDDDIFGDDDIAVCDGKETDLGFMDPPESDSDDDGPGFDTGNNYDDGFPT